MRINKLFPEFLLSNKDYWSIYKKMSDVLGHTIHNSPSCVDAIDLLNNIKIWEEKIDNVFPDLKLEQKQIISTTLYNLNQVTYTNLISMYYYFRNPIKNYVICKDFYNKFKNLNMEKLLCQDVNKVAAGYIRLPEPIVDDQGDEFWDLFFVVDYPENVFNCKSFSKKVPEYPETDKVILGSLFNKNSAVERSLYSYIPKNGNPPLLKMFSKDYSYSIGRDLMNKKDITELPVFINLIAYIMSGQPDIRSFRNEVRFRSSGSTKVVRKDRDLSTLDMDLVGYSWLKKRQSYTNEWWTSTHIMKYRDASGTLNYTTRRGHLKKRQS